MLAGRPHHPRPRARSTGWRSSASRRRIASFARRPQPGDLLILDQATGDWPVGQRPAAGPDVGRDLDGGDQFDALAEPGRVRDPRRARHPRRHGRHGLRAPWARAGDGRASRTSFVFESAKLARLDVRARPRLAMASRRRRRARPPLRAAGPDARADVGQELVTLAQTPRLRRPARRDLDRRQGPPPRPRSRRRSPLAGRPGEASPSPRHPRVTSALTDAPPRAGGRDAMRAPLDDRLPSAACRRAVRRSRQSRPADLPRFGLPWLVALAARAAVGPTSVSAAPCGSRERWSSSDRVAIWLEDDVAIAA